VKDRVIGELQEQVDTLRFMLHGKGGRGEIGQFTSTDAENF
jgi:hypothetical protein